MPIWLTGGTAGNSAVSNTSTVTTAGNQIYWVDTSATSTASLTTSIWPPRFTSITTTSTIPTSYIPQIYIPQTFNQIDWIQREEQQRWWDHLYYPYEPQHRLSIHSVPQAPAIIRPNREEVERREAEREHDLYREALAAHDMQEAERINRLITARIEAAQARQRELAAQVAAREAERQRREAATARARELLIENLTPEQRRTVEQNNWFVVEGGRSKTKYRINTSRGYSGNIEVLDQRDSVRHRLCCHVNQYRVDVPLGDHLLAQKIMLELAEDDFLRLANVHR